MTPQRRDHASRRVQSLCGTSVRVGRDAGSAPTPAPKRPFVILHPGTVHVPTLLQTVETVFTDAGWPPPKWAHTSPEEAGTAITRAAVRDGADLVVCCGGDGTVRAVATALSGSGIPLVVVPTGTGNLLARNLDLPLDAERAISVATRGEDCRLDLGKTGDHCFTAMAGIGLDAAMVRDASPRLKKSLGWPAYLAAAARHLADPSMRVRLRVDDGPLLHRRAKTIVIGNIGSLQGGRPLLPKADPSDGLLDVAVVAPRRPWDWLRIAGRVARGRGSADDLPLERMQCRHLEIDTGWPQPYELDGDPLGETSRFVAQVCSGALIVRLPA